MTKKMLAKAVHKKINQKSRGINTKRVNERIKKGLDREVADLRECLENLADKTNINKLALSFKKLAFYLQRI